MPSSHAQNSNDSDSPSAVERMLDELLQMPADRRLERLAAMCDAEPDLADELRERFRALEQLGLLEQDTPEPTTLAEFTLLEQIGEGGMGLVYHAHQHGLDREVAVKTMRPEIAWLPQQRRRFQREGRVAAGLEHPAIVPVLHIGEHEGAPFLVMKYVPGASAADVVKTLCDESPAALDGSSLLHALQTGSAEVDEVAVAASVRGLQSRWSRVVCSLLLPIADALAYAHARGVVHRDVKPSNILLGPDARPYLCDFGLAAVVESDDQLTRSGALLGSVPYMSPEQVDGHLADARSDVFAFGSVLYELLTLKRAFGTDSSSNTMHAITYEEPRATANEMAHCERDLLAILWRCLEKDPARRYQQGTELADDLRAFLEGRPVTARRLTPLRRVARYARREPVRFSLATATAVLLLLLAGTFGYLYAEKDALAAGQQKLANDQVEHLLARGYLAWIRGDAATAKTAMQQCLALQDDSVAARSALAILDGNEQPITHANDQTRLFVQATQDVFDGVRIDRAGARRAVALLQEAMLHAGNARPVLHGMFAMACTLAGEQALAQQAVAALRQLWPESPTASYWIGHALLEIDTQQALDAFTHVTEHCPSDAEAWHSVGAAHLLLQQPRQAIEAFDRALQIDEDNAYSWIDRGLAHAALGDQPQAEQDLRRATECRNALPGAHYNLGVQLMQRDAAAAIDCFRRTVAISAIYPEAWYNLGALLTETGKLDEGRDALRKAVELRPKWSNAWRHLGTNRATAGDAAGAAEAYEHVTALEPEDQQARAYLDSLRAHIEQHPQDGN